MHNRLLIITFTIAIFFCSIQTVTSDISSYYYGSLSQNSETYFRPGQTSNTYRYQSLQVVIYTSGKYTFRSNSSLDTYGYLYSGSFDPLSPSRNLIASDDDSGGSGQFLINATLTYGTTYILVVTTFHPNITGPFSITALGLSTVYFIPLTTTTTATTSTTTSSPLIPSYYYGSLSSSSGTYARPGQTGNTFRYEAIQVTIFTSGKYTFKSYSSLDTYGYLYSYSFDPLNPSQNLIASDDDSGGSGQFLLNVTLTYGTRYILVVSTYSPNVTGTYSVTALGPLSVTFSRLTPSTPVPFTTTSPRPVPSYYSSSLSQRSSIYARPGQSSRSYYYEAIRVAIYSSGGYILRSSSTLDTYGYLYLDSFDPLNPTINLIASDDDSGGSSQFLLNVTLAYGRTYILVVTTYGPSVTGSYGVAVLGPSSASFSPYQPTTTVPTTTVGPLIPSSYSGALSPSSGIYARPDQASDTYYYQAIQVFVYTSGRYTFKSSSSLDTYGYFYSTSFDAYNPSLNLFASDDDSGGNRQFLLNVTLTYGRTYILVVTTYSPNVLGSFSVHALGPAVVSWSDIPPTFSSTLSDAEISAVVIGCIVFFGILLSSCAYRRFRQRTVNRRAVYLTADRKVQLGTSGSQMPYVVSSDYAHGSSVEKPPLSSN